MLPPRSNQRTRLPSTRSTFWPSSQQMLRRRKRRSPRRRRSRYLQQRMCQSRSRHPLLLPHSQSKLRSPTHYRSIKASQRCQTRPRCRPMLQRLIQSWLRRLWKLQSRNRRLPLLCLCHRFLYRPNRLHLKRRMMQQWHLCSLSWVSRLRLSEVDK